MRALVRTGNSWRFVTSEKRNLCGERAGTAVRETNAVQLPAPETPKSTAQTYKTLRLDVLRLNLREGRNILSSIEDKTEL